MIFVWARREPFGLEDFISRHTRQKSQRRGIPCRMTIFLNIMVDGSCIVVCCQKQLFEVDAADSR
jgi:hypothetical protein